MLHQSSYAPTLLAICLVTVLVLAWLTHRTPSRAPQLTTSSNSFYNIEIPFEGSPIDVKYEIPKYLPLKGILFVAHGCSHGAGDFWPRSDSCPDCLGLPEEIRIRKMALNRGYVVVAISSADRDVRCWGEIDMERVAHALSLLLNSAAQTKLKGLPLYGFGASSGGMFTLMLASHPTHLFDAICSQIMSLHPAQEEMESHISRSPGLYPPTLFVHMPRDQMTAQAVSDSMVVLNKHKIPTKEIRVDPSPLTTQYLSDSIGEELSLDQSKSIYDAFKKHEVINDKGFLIGDPRSSDWRSALSSLSFYDELRLTPDESPIAEELNVLWAGHEIIARTTDEMIDWFEQTRS